MKTKIFSLIAALLTFSAFADYLYWMVDIGEGNEEFRFCYATVSADGTLLSNNTSGGDPAYELIGNTALEEGTELGSKTDAVYAYGFSEALTSTFLFELYDANEKLLLSRTVSAASLSDYIGTSMGQISSPFVIPEPTSGLLMLVGLAGLALRRRRA